MQGSGQVIIVGASGHGREIAHVLRARGLAGLPTPRLLGFVDDGDIDEALLAPFGPLLGRVREGLEEHPEAAVLGGVGDGLLRERLVFGHAPADPLVHPSADVGPDVTVGRGSVICSHASLTTHITVGEHVHVSRGAAIGHDAVLEDYVSIMPLAAVSGDVQLGRGCFVGTGAAIRQGVHVGPRAVVGMGAVVLRDVPPGVTVVGSPARPVQAPNTL